jgi:hypothetical protein
LGYDGIAIRFMDRGKHRRWVGLIDLASQRRALAHPIRVPNHAEIVSMFAKGTVFRLPPNHRLEPALPSVTTRARHGSRQTIVRLMLVR